MNRGINEFDGIRWLHANTFNPYQYTTPTAPYPISIVCQLSSRGVKLNVKADSVLPHARGAACSLEEGLELQLPCILPDLPLTVSRLSTVASLCSQPDRSTTLTVLEAISHWTEKSQWLARGLKHHTDGAFLNKPHTSNLEADELQQVHESAISHLVEAYASPDG